jgi:excisionase family DNA binding protein
VHPAAIHKSAQLNHPGGRRLAETRGRPVTRSTRGGHWNVERGQQRQVDDLPLLLTVDEAAGVLRIGRNGAYAAVANGSLPSVRIGRTIRVRGTPSRCSCGARSARPRIQRPPEEVEMRQGRVFRRCGKCNRSMDGLERRRCARCGHDRQT